eukprot:SAG22_NODE_293_length_12891_cov_17.337242_6_plen_2071_part_00
MGLTSHELVTRLFHSFDDDNTGALELLEFVQGLRRMCEYRRDRGHYRRDKDFERAEKKRNEFAFRLLDQDRGGLVEMSEVQDFLDGFLGAAKQEALGWIDKFELLLGAAEGAAAAREALGADADLGRTLQDSLAAAEAHSEDFVRVSGFAELPADDDIEAMFEKTEALAAYKKPAKIFVVPDGQAYVSFMDTFTDGESNADLRKQHKQKVDAVAKILNGFDLNGSELEAEACSGIDAKQFVEWCSSSGSGRINVAAWLRIVGDSWIRTMAIPMSERDIGEIAWSASPAASAVPSARGAGLSYDEQLRQSVDQCFASYALDGHMHRRRFVRCLRRLGLSHSGLAHRFFELFDRRLRQFLDREDFQDMFRVLLQATATERDQLVFTLLAPDGSGYIEHSELEKFVSEFFGRCRTNYERGSANKELSGSHTVFGALCTIVPGASIAAYADAAEQYLGSVLDLYQQKFVEAAFDQTEGGRMYFDQFWQWNQGRAASWLTSLTASFVSNLANDVDDPEVEQPAEAAKPLRKALDEPAKAGMLAKKIESQRQSGLFSSASKQAAPSCKFSKTEVQVLQEIFNRLACSGQMAMANWKTFFGGMSVVNSYAIERLFNVCDADHSKQMNFKEFLWGLSTICHGREEERLKFTLRFYDLNDDMRKPSVSKVAFLHFLNQFQPMCAKAVAKATSYLGNVYGKNMTELKTNEAGLKRRRELDNLFDQIKQELKLYCEDVWDFGVAAKDFQLSNPEDSIEIADFAKFTESAPAVKNWLTELGAAITVHLGQFDKSEPAVVSEEGARYDDVDPNTMVLSEYKMIEAFDKFAVPKRIDGGDRTLLTLRTTSFHHVLAGPHQLVQTAGNFGKTIETSNISSELHVDMHLAMMRAERYFDMQTKVNMSSATLLSFGPRFIRAVAAALGCHQTAVWVLGGVVDGGPSACYVNLRVLGTPAAAGEAVRILDLSPAPGAEPGVAQKYELATIDTIDAVFTMDWAASEIRSKLEGGRGLKSSLASALSRDAEHIWISVADTDEERGRSRISVSVVQNGDDVMEARRQLLDRFPAICDRIGLVRPKEQLFHDSVVALSNTNAQQFATSAQENFTKVLGARFQSFAEEVQIRETAWPSPYRALVKLRFFAIDVASQTNPRPLKSDGARQAQWKLSLMRNLHTVIGNGDLSSDLRRRMLDFDVAVADHADSVFSLKTEFVQSMKASGYWQSLIAKIKDVYEDHLSADDFTRSQGRDDSDGGDEDTSGEDDDDEDEDEQQDTCEVIAGTMNEHQFVACLKSMGFVNSVFAQRLFGVFDEDKSGTIEVGEFVDYFRQLHEGSDDEKHRILYSIHSGGDTRGITAKRMRLFVRSFFAGTEKKCRQLRQQLDEILHTVPLSDLSLRFSGDRYVVARRTAIRKACDTAEEDFDYSDTSHKDNKGTLEVGGRVSVLESRQVGPRVRIRVRTNFTSPDFKEKKGDENWASVSGRNGDTLLSPRMDKGAIAMALQKNFANEIDWHVDSLVDFAMSAGTVEPGFISQAEFRKWVHSKTTLLQFLSSIVKPWLVSADEEPANSLVAEAQGTDLARVAGIDSDARLRSLEALKDSNVSSQIKKHSTDARNALKHVIAEDDIGKTLDQVVRAGANSKQYPHEMDAAGSPTEQGGLRWARAFTIIHRSEAVIRQSVRPRTHFDILTLSDIEFAFSASMDKKAVLEFSPGSKSFCAGLQLLGLNNPQMSRRVFDLFVRKQADACQWCGQNYQHSPSKPNKRCLVFGLMLLAKGPRLDLYHRAFNLFESDREGKMDREAFFQILGVLHGFCMAAIEDVVNRISEVLGPEPITRQEETAANQFKHRVLAQASSCLDAVCRRIFAEAFSSWSVKCWHMDAADFVGHDDAAEDAFLTRPDFVAFVRENARLSAWFAHVGNACVEALSSSHDQFSGVLTESDKPSCARRVGHKYPLGTHFEKISSEAVRRVFEAQSIMGKIDPDQFASCLHDLQIRNSFTIKRLFRLFDSDQSGFIEMHEFASSFFLVCNDPVDQKLQKAFAMYDMDASGFLEATELMSMLKSFSIIGLDAVGSSMSIVADILGDGKLGPTRL